MGGVSEAHITQQCRPGRTFHPATVGDKVDVGHPILAEWLAKRQKIKASATKKKATKKKPKARYASPSTAAADAPSKEVEGLADSGTSKAPAEWGNLTLHEIAAVLGLAQIAEPHRDDQGATSQERGGGRLPDLPGLGRDPFARPRGGAASASVDGSAKDRGPHRASPRTSRASPAP